MPFKAMWATLLALLALLGEEFRRWVGILTAGLLIFLAGKATLNYAPPDLKKPLALIVLALVAVWSLAALRAARFTMGNNLRAVRQRMWFRELAGNVKDLRGSLTGRIATATRGTPAAGVFKANREERAAEERRAAAAAELERRAELERAAEERRRDEVADMEPDPYTWERT